MESSPDRHAARSSDDASEVVAASPVPARRAGRWNRWDALALAGYCAGAVWVTSRLLTGNANAMVRNQSDEAVSEWFFGHGAYWVTHGGDPFFSRQILVPAGANMMVNTSMLGLSVPLAPITLAFGAHVTFVVVLIGAFAGTGYAWYHVMSRYFGVHRGAAVLAGAVCGFGPAMMGHAEGQLDLVANFLLPLIVAAVLRLREPGHTVRRGVVLGVLVGYQVMIVEEPLFLAGVAMILFLVCYGIQRPRAARAALLPMLGGLAVAGTTTILLVGYPLWLQFYGPRHGTGLMSTPANSGVTLNQFIDSSPSSLGGNPTLNNDIWARSESNTYFGWWLLSAVVVLLIWQYRNVAMRSLLAAGLGVALLSCGKTITNGHWSITGPFRWVSTWPLFDTVTPPRFGIAVTCVIGVLLALGADRLLRVRRTGVAWAGYGVLCLALLPLVPTPLSVVPGPVVPRFITSGAWRDYVGPGESVIVVPSPTIHTMEAMRWGSATDTALPLVRGYMLAPIGADGSLVAYDPPQRPLGALLDHAALSGTVPKKISAARRQEVMVDLWYWHAAIVCVAADRANADAVLRVGSELFGPPRLVEGVWLWDVRGIPAGG